MDKLFYLLAEAESAATLQNSLDINSYLSVSHLNFENPRTLCETLFHELDTNFQQFFSALKDLSKAEGEQPNLHSRSWEIFQNLNLVLRCCLLVLKLLQSQQKLPLEICRYVRHILNAFVSVEVCERNGRTFMRFPKCGSGECASNHGGIANSFAMELSDCCRPFLCAVLEVFADELLRHQSLRKYLMIANAASSICGNLFVCQVNLNDFAIVMEVISTHFILSTSDEKAFENFISRLFLLCGKDFKFPELGLAPSIVLLQDPIVLFAPKMFRAHLISLISEALGYGLSSDNLASDRHMDCHLIAFEKSVILYSMHMSSLHLDGFYVELKYGNNSYLPGRDQPTFESYIQKVTSNRLNEVLSKSDNSWDSYPFKNSFKTKANYLAEYIAFKNRWQHIFADSCGDMITSILDCIIHRTFSQDAAGDVLNIKETISPSDIFLLASILKLMSVSLMQVVKCLSHGGNSHCLKTMGSTRHEKYDFLISIVNHFQHLKIHLSIQTYLCDVLKCQQTNHEASKLMLVHFSGLLSLSFSSGLDLLAKGCISIIMSLVSLFVFEEGNLVDLGSLRDLPLQPCSSEIPCDDSGEVKQSIYKIAAEYHRIRTRNLRMDSISSSNSVDDETEETCNGEIFLDCVLKGSQRLSDFAELADFLECKKGKNYSSWLQSRQVYRKWRHEKMLDRRKIKKKEIWKSLRR